MKKIFVISIVIIALSSLIYGFINLTSSNSYSNSKDFKMKNADSQENLLSNNHLTKISDLPGKEISFGSGKLFFLNKQEGWLANGNQLWRTRDSGKNWELIFENSNDSVPEEFSKGDFANIYAILFQNSKAGWMTDHSNLYKTQDGGFTWEKDEFWTKKLDKGFMTKIYQSEDGTIFVVGAIERKLSKPVAARDAYKAFVSFQKSNRSRWQEAIIPSDVYRFEAIEFLNNKSAVAIGRNSHEMLISRDGGRIWSKSTINKQCVDKKLAAGFDRKPVAIAALSKNELLVSYTDGRIIKSIDSGKTWCDFYLPEKQTEGRYFIDLYFVDSKNGFSIKGNQKLYRTSDGGESWENIEFDRKFYYFIEVEGEHFAVTEKEIYRINPIPFN